MEKSEFSRLIEKYEKGLLSESEKASLDVWFEEFGKNIPPANWTEEDKVRLKDKLVKRIEAQNEKSASIGDGDEGLMSRRWFSGNAFRVAASLLLVAGVSYMLWHFSGVTTQKQAITHQVSTTHAIRQIILGDGSIVWLKPNSSLTYPEVFAEEKRFLTLRGEALFEVAKESSRPFIIQCGGLTTTVLGTSFNIRSSAENIEVVVLTGKVSLTSEVDQQGVVLLPTEKAVYSLDEKQIAKVKADVAIQKEETVAAVVMGTTYPMDFHDTRMRDVIKRVEAKFNVRIHIDNPKIGNCMITADFTGESLQRTLDMISQALTFEYDIDESHVTLRGAGCNERTK